MLKAWKIFVVMLGMVVTRVAWAGADSTNTQSLAPLWPLVGLMISNGWAYLARKLSTTPGAFFHSPLGHGAITLVGMMIGAVVPIIQAHGFAWTALAWAAAGAATAFFTALNPSSVTGQPTPMSVPSGLQPPPPPRTAVIIPWLALPLIGMTLAGCSYCAIPQNQSTTACKVAKVASDCGRPEILRVVFDILGVIAADFVAPNWDKWTLFEKQIEDALAARGIKDGPVIFSCAVHVLYQQPPELIAAEPTGASPALAVNSVLRAHLLEWIKAHGG